MAFQYQGTAPTYSGNVAQPVVSGPFGGAAPRDPIGSWLFATDVAKEDWIRAEQSALLSHEREARFADYQTDKANAFTEYMRDTALTSQINQMRENGINPVMALGSLGGGSSASGATSHASGGTPHGGSSGSSGSGIMGSLLSMIGMIVAGNVSGSSAKLLEAIKSSNAKELAAFKHANALDLEVAKSANILARQKAMYDYTKKRR